MYVLKVIFRPFLQDKINQVLPLTIWSTQFSKNFDLKYETYIFLIFMRWFQKQDLRIANAYLRVNKCWNGIGRGQKHYLWTVPIRRYSSITWTKSYPILTIYPPPLKWTIVSIYKISTLCSSDQAWTFYWPPIHLISCRHSYWMPTNT